MYFLLSAKDGAGRGTGRGAMEQGELWDWRGS